MGLQARAHRVAACSTHRAAARSLQHTQGRSLQPVPARECFELCKLDSAAAVDVRIAEHALERIIRHEYAALPERRLELGQGDAARPVRIESHEGATQLGAHLLAHARLGLRPPCEVHRRLLGRRVCEQRPGLLHDARELFKRELAWWWVGGGGGKVEEAVVGSEGGLRWRGWERGVGCRAAGCRL